MTVIVEYWTITSKSKWLEAHKALKARTPHSSGDGWKAQKIIRPNCIYFSKRRLKSELISTMRWTKTVAPSMCGQSKCEQALWMFGFNQSVFIKNQFTNGVSDKHPKQYLFISTHLHYRLFYRTARCREPSFVFWSAYTLFCEFIKGSAKKRHNRVII